MKKIKKANILFFQNSILPTNGGVPRVSDIISQELTKRGYKCYFIYYDKDNTDYSSIIKLKIDVKQSYEKIERSVLNFIQEKDINIFICQNAHSRSFIKLYKSIRLLYPSYQFVCFLHPSPDYWRISYQLKNSFFKYNFFIVTAKNIVKSIVYPFYNPYLKSITSLYSLSDKFALLSDTFKESFIKLYTLNNYNKLITIPNPLTFDDFISISDVNKKEKIVLIVSRLVEDQKRISLSLRIWQKVTEKSNADWKLFIVGSGKDESFYKKYVSNNNLKNVIFLGEKSNVIDYYQKASIFMMTSIWEGLPMALLEAQQNGVVPIAFDNFSAVHDVISDSQSGYIIPSNDLSKFAIKLDNIMNDDKLRHSMALNSISSSKRFHISRIADIWEYVINT